VATEKFNSDYYNATLGFNGFDYVAGTANNTGTWCCIQTLTNTTFTSMTARGTGTAPVAVAIPTGTYIYGLFTQFQLTSGSVIAYKY
jgi:hypothetical protein